jgi:hypothetical protein
MYLLAACVQNRPAVRAEHPAVLFVSS